MMSSVYPEATACEARGAEFVERLAKTGFAISRAEERRQRGGEKIAGGDATQLFEIAIERMGCGSLSVWQFSGFSSRMLRSVPM